MVSLTHDERIALRRLIDNASRERVRRTALAELEIAAVIARPIEAEDRLAEGITRKGNGYKPMHERTPEEAEATRAKWRAKKVRQRAEAMHRERMGQ